MFIPPLLWLFLALEVIFGDNFRRSLSKLPAESHVSGRAAICAAQHRNLHLALLFYVNNAGILREHARDWNF